MATKNTDWNQGYVERYNSTSSSVAYYFWIAVNETYNQSTNVSTVTYTLWFDNASSGTSNWWASTAETYQPKASLYVGEVYRTYGYVRSAAQAYNPNNGANYTVCTWSSTHTHAADGSYSTTCGFTTTAGTGAYSEPYGPKTVDKRKVWSIGTSNGFFTQPKVIYYNANNGSSTPATQYYSSSAVTLASAISRSASTSSTTVNIAYNANGGNSTPSTQTSTKKTTTSYTFNGWHEGSATGTNHAAGSSFSPSANVTLYAGWNTSTTTTYSAITLASAISRTSTTSNTTITTSFNVNGGTSAAPGALTSTKTTTQPYTFNKWAKGSASGTQYSAGASYTPDGATTMYATWTNGTLTTTYSAITLPAAPTRTGWTFNGWYTASSGGTKAGNAGASYRPTANGTLYAQWTQNNYSIVINPNGGNYNGSASNTTLSNKHYGDTIAIAEPTRPGYTFVGWVETGSGSISQYTNADPAFDVGTGGVGVYNNSGGGTVVHTRQSSSAGTTTYGSYEILINTTDGTTSPGLGGFVNTTTSAANKKYIHMFYAKLPSGYNLMHAANATGDGRAFTWISDKAGSGSYKVYAYQLQCGSSGTFSTFGHVYVESGTKPLSWNLAYSTVWDITNGKSVTYNVGAGAGRLTAMWVLNKYTVTFNANGGTVSPTTREITYNSRYTDFPKPVRDGYAFKGWFINCANAASTAVNMGKAYKYTTTLNIHFVTYSTDYSTWTNYRLISCTEGGGWNIENNSGKIRFQMYDATAAAYNGLEPSTTWASLTPGFHQWDVIFASSTLTCYIDGVSLGSKTFSGTSIGYNATNSIFIGAEATSSDTTPTTPYLNGYVGNIVISNSATRITDLGRQRFTTPAQNVTLYALWEPYFNVYIKGRTSGWVNLKNGQNWQN